MEKISIIICVFQVAHYLPECIASCLNQTYQNIEILLVNDGSPDDSLRICEHYRREDSRVRIVSTANHGVSIARNYGLRAATGDYITFVDADDKVAPDYLRHLYHSLKGTASDIAVGSYYRLDNQGVFHFISDPNNPEHQQLEHCYTPRDFFQARRHQLINQNFEYVWGKLFKRRLFDLVEFPTKRVLAEDAYTTWKLYLQAQRISFTIRDEYCYRIRSDSATEKKNLVDLRANVLRGREEQAALLNAVDVSQSSLDPAQEMASQLALLPALTPADAYRIRGANYLKRVVARYRQH